MYGIGQASEGIKNYAFTTFLLFYYTSVIGLPGTWAGVALMIALVFDAVTDPVVAVISDRTHSRWGRRHPYMFLSALPLAIFFYLTFAPPDDPGAWLGVDRESGLLAWLIIFAVLTRGAMTLFHVPHMALGAELSDDFDERTRVVAARSLASVVGTAAAVTAYFVLVDLMQTPDYADPRLNPAPYATFAAVFGIVIFLSVLTSVWGTADRIPHLEPPDQPSGERTLFGAVGSDLGGALRIRSFRALFFGFTLCFLSFGVTNALGTHNALYLWHITVEQQAIWGIFVLFGLLFGMSFWRKVAERSDKKPTFLMGMLCFVVFAAAPPLFKASGWFPAEDSILYIPLFVSCGFFFAFGIASSMVMVGSMMADITDEDELLHGRRREGIFFGALSLAGKAASGAGVIIAGLVYDAVGLYRGLDPAVAATEISTRLGIVSGSVILVLCGFSLVLFVRYDLSRERQAEIRRQLDARTAAA
jgi:GPH family glycoside/pentoside/hexuronide:cation symporter